MNHADRARGFLVDAERARWHDRALWFVREKRDHAASTLKEWEVLRERAAAIKAHALSRLPDYLEEFERNANRNGVVVHWAADAREHDEIVHGLLASRGARRVVKSKSMLTEECGLNPYLEARGIEVTDTDLGEWIVQMRRERPSHIVMPAIHVRREEVGALFHERLGTAAGADDPRYLTEVARGRLRRRLLEADAGITGVNFAVAETGGIVVCTNEGNADLGASLPSLHIASMGIEKVVPRLADLAVFLRLLARSATGQPITSYASHFSGPRRGGELHVVIVDNGRSDLLGHEAFSRSLACIRCGACMNTCPVYRRSGGHSYDATVPGPIGSILGPARAPDRHRSLPFACTTCGSCTDVCPVGIDLHGLLLRAREELSRSGRVPLTKRLALSAAAFILEHPAAYRTAAVLLRRAPGVFRRAAFAKWLERRDLPAIPPRTFREEYRRRHDVES